jgi:hypothetical protein
MKMIAVRICHVYNLVSYASSKTRIAVGIHRVCVDMTTGTYNSKISMAVTRSRCDAASSPLSPRPSNQPVISNKQLVMDCIESICCSRWGYELHSNNLAILRPNLDRRSEIKSMTGNCLLELTRHVSRDCWHYANNAEFRRLSIVTMK